VCHRRRHRRELASQVGHDAQAVPAGSLLVTRPLGDVGPSAMASYIETRTRHDWWYLTSEVLEQGVAASQPHPLAEVIRGRRLARRPEELVFCEEPSRVIGADGRSIASWVG
jgi:hypothetical protein